MKREKGVARMNSASKQIREEGKQEKGKVRKGQK